MRPCSRSLSRRRYAVVVALVVALGGACADDESTDVSPTSTSAATTATTDPLEPTATTEPTSATEPPATTVSTDGTADSTASTPSTAGDTEAIETTRAVFAAITPDLPGCTVAVSRDGEVVYAEAFGAARLDPLEPMTTETVVDIGSTSKQFTATALLLLAQRGQVDLDAPLSTYLVDLPAWADEPTVRQLMHHESGIPDYIDLLLDAGFGFDEVTTDADTLAVLDEVDELDFEPGTDWAYSNSNYFLIGQVVLAVTGDDLGTFLAGEVFDPLGLDMVMDPTADIAAKAVSYEDVDGEPTVADSPWQQLGDGAIQTTPSELVRWAAEYWAPEVAGLTIDDRLDQAVAVPGVEGDGVYGAGIFATSSPADDELGTVLRHSGGWGGFVTAFSLAPERRVAIAATCTSPDSAALLGSGGGDGDIELELLRIWSNT